MNSSQFTTRMKTNALIIAQEYVPVCFEFLFKTPYLYISLIFGVLSYFFGFSAAMNDLYSVSLLLLCFSGYLLYSKVMVYVPYSEGKKDALAYFHALDVTITAIVIQMIGIPVLSEILTIYGFCFSFYATVGIVKQTYKALQNRFDKLKEDTENMVNEKDTDDEIKE